MQSCRTQPDPVSPRSTTTVRPQWRRGAARRRCHGVAPAARSAPERAPRALAPARLDRNLHDAPHRSHPHPDGTLMPGVMVAAARSRPGRSHGRTAGARPRPPRLRSSGSRPRRKGCVDIASSSRPSSSTDSPPAWQPRCAGCARCSMAIGIAPDTFDLADAIDPVVACARASGLDVRVSVPRGIEVVGRRDTTAQVVLGLLDNARRHAPGSPVGVRALGVGRRGRRCVVEDRGTGIPGSVARAHLRTGGARRRERRLRVGPLHRPTTDDRAGRVDRRPLRRGGGTSFVLRFRRAG